MTEKRFNVFDVDGTIFLEDHKKGSYHIGENGNVDVNCLNDIADRLNELYEENEQLKEAKKFFEEVLFNVIYATADYQRLVLNKELLEVIDESKSLEELREKANFGVEEFREEHKWLE